MKGFSGRGWEVPFFVNDRRNFGKSAYVHTYKKKYKFCIGMVEFLHWIRIMKTD